MTASPLVIWSGTESAVTIMAASVLMLRVLFKSVRPKRQPTQRVMMMTNDRGGRYFRPIPGRKSFYNRPRKDLADG